MDRLPKPSRIATELYESDTARHIRPTRVQSTVYPGSSTRLPSRFSPLPVALSPPCSRASLRLANVSAASTPSVPSYINTTVTGGASAGALQDLPSASPSALKAALPSEPSRQLLVQTPSHPVSVRLVDKLLRSLIESAWRSIRGSEPQPEMS